MEVLTFLYTGLPDISEDEDQNFVKEIQAVAEKFQLAWTLSGICTNLLEGDSLKFVNPSIGTWLNDNTVQAAKKLFLNKPFLSDLKFHVEGTIVYGHKLILKARSQVMASIYACWTVPLVSRESDLDTDVQCKAWNFGSQSK